jgi:hypothetical protein
MIMQDFWLCLGGPLHGRWRPPAEHLTVTEKVAPVEYRSVFGRRTVALPAAAVLYRPTMMCLPGWSVKLPVWAEDRLARGLAAPMFACVLPGGLHGVPRDAAWACRWCYGRPMDGMETCSRAACIRDWHAVRSLDTTTWRGEDR